MPHDPLVTDEMRMAARNYWTSIHSERQLIPIGEINGILEAGISAMLPLEPAPDVSGDEMGGKMRRVIAALHGMSTPPISGDAIEAALDEWHSGNHWMRAADTAWIAVERERAARAIAAADAARGRSCLTWRDPADFVVTPGSRTARWVLVRRIDQLGASPAHFSRFPLDLGVTAWAEMPEEWPEVAHDIPAAERDTASEEYAPAPATVRSVARFDAAREAILRYLARWAVHHIHRLEDGKAEFDAAVREVWPE